MKQFSEGDESSKCMWERHDTESFFFFAIKSASTFPGFYLSWDINNLLVSRTQNTLLWIGERKIYGIWFDNIITDSQTIGDDADWNFSLLFFR